MNWNKDYPQTDYSSSACLLPFSERVRHVSATCRARPPKRWTRLIIEKPFGKDSDSFAELDASTSAYWSEDELFRIDHYLGKEVVLNLKHAEVRQPALRADLERDMHRKPWKSPSRRTSARRAAGGYFDGFGADSA